MDNQRVYIREDYTQSANYLINFVKESRFLEEIITNKYVLPRYCKENVEYLQITNGEDSFDEILVLQKCFCDIQLSKLREETVAHREGMEDNVKGFTHTDIYGEYGIALTKEWGERNGLQPIHYINEESEYGKDLSEWINNQIWSEDIREADINTLLKRVAHIKPLRGKMEREKEGKVYLLEKNFHDEKEWRYVPNIEADSGIEIVIANPNYFHESNSINREIEKDRFKSLRLPFEYSDIRFIVVPNNVERINIIKKINSLSEEKFKSNEDIDIQRGILTSKLVLLDEIRKDL